MGEAFCNAVEARPKKMSALRRNCLPGSGRKRLRRVAEDQEDA